MVIDGFDWDEGNFAKCHKHGVSVAEIEPLFRQDHRIAPDFKHSALECAVVGHRTVRSGRPLFVVFTLRERDGKQLLRSISARYMHGEKIERYEQSRS